MSNKFLIFDGAMGSELIKNGLKSGELPERLNITNAEMVTQIHKAYKESGANIITANTFGANRFKITDKKELKAIIEKGISLAKSVNSDYVALDVGPTGKMFEPLGDLTFDTAYETFAEIVKIGAKAGADIAVIETMSDLLEAKAGVLAVKENSNMKVYATMSVEQNGRTFLGVDIKSAIITLSGLGVDAVGLNCSLGAKEMVKLFPIVAEYATVPIIVQPNAGLPEIIHGETVYSVTAEEWAESVIKMADMGAEILGGCCGTTPEYIKTLCEKLKDKSPVKRTLTHYSVATSAQKAVFFDGGVTVIGERLNPTGKKKLKQALINGDFEYVLDEARRQINDGAEILDINAGVPEINESAVLSEAVRVIQRSTDVPLQLDSASADAIACAARIYNGKPLINSVNGTKESMERIFPIAKKYGAAVIGLTLNEKVPQNARERVEIARTIYETALTYGIKKEDIIIDCLTMTLSAAPEQASETLKAVKAVETELGLKTVLGVSNISFGLPEREKINAVFLSEALASGLNMCIINPCSNAYKEVILCHNLIENQKNATENYITAFSSTEPNKTENALTEAILSGDERKIVSETKELLKTKNSLEIINDFFIPALNVVGARFESGKTFLPQLVKSAEAVKKGFEILPFEKKQSEKSQKILLATVKGDIHDIGKNIVKLLLQSYGYEVVDMGRDVDYGEVLSAIEREKIELVGLSALMTTTVKNMKTTIELIRERFDCKIMVGGAVMTDEYAKAVGADYYAKDAQESVKLAQKFFANKLTSNK